MSSVRVMASASKDEKEKNATDRQRARNHYPSSTKSHFCGADWRLSSQLRCALECVSVAVVRTSHQGQGMADTREYT